MRIDSVKVGDVIRSPICDYPELWDNAIALYVDVEPHHHSRIFIYWLWSDGTINRQKYGKDYDAEMSTY